MTEGMMNASSIINADLYTIAARVLAEEDQLIVSGLIQEGKIELVKQFLLFGIDKDWIQGALTFEDAAELYASLDMPPERAARFRQQNLGILYL